MVLGNAEAIEMASEEGTAFVSRLTVARGLALGRVAGVNGEAWASAAILSGAQPQVPGHASPEGVLEICEVGGDSTVPSCPPCVESV